MERIKGISQEMEDLESNNIPQSHHNTSGNMSLGGKDLNTLEKQEKDHSPALHSQTTTNIPLQHIEAIKVCYFNFQYMEQLYITAAL